MIDILPRNDKPDRWAQAFGNLTQAAGQGMGEMLRGQQQQNQQAQLAQKLQQLTGQDLSGLPPEMQQLAFKSALEAQNQPNKFAQQYNAKAQAQLDLMRQLGLNDILDQEEEAFEQAEKNPKQNLSEDQNQRMGKSTSKLIPENKIAAMAMINPAVADKMQKHNDNIISQQRHEETQKRAERDVALREKRASPEYQRESQIEASQAQADVNYNKQLEEASKQHALKEQTLDRLESLNKKGVTGKPYEKLLEKFGLVNLTSEGRREFAADVKNLITDIRSILGGQFSTFEFQTILNAYPSADFSKGANEAIIRNLKSFQDIKSKEVEFARQMKKENGGKTPFDFQSKVNEMVHDYAQTKMNQIKSDTQKIMNEEYGIPQGKTLMLDPQGEPLSVPVDEIEKYLELGAFLP